MPVAHGDIYKVEFFLHVKLLGGDRGPKTKKKIVLGVVQIFATRGATYYFFQKCSGGDRGPKKWPKIVLPYSSIFNGSYPRAGFELC